MKRKKFRDGDMITFSVTICRSFGKSGRRTSFGFNYKRDRFEIGLKNVKVNGRFFFLPRWDWFYFRPDYSSKSVKNRKFLVTAKTLHVLFSAANNNRGDKDFFGRILKEKGFISKIKNRSFGARSPGLVCLSN